MNLNDVRALEPLSRFFYWCRERQAIAERRHNGMPHPEWTDDPILATYRFTHVFREEDKTTAWFRNYVREPLKYSSDVIFATVCFRWFNWIPTGEVLHKRGLLVEWDESETLRILGARRNRGEQVFTGAFMINSQPGYPKLEYICGCVDRVFGDNRELKRRALDWTTLEQAHRDLQRYERLGGFMAYEIVCDLRHTQALNHVTDVNTWAHLGPGARRGLLRAMGKPIETKKSHGLTLVPLPPDWHEWMGNLLQAMQHEPWAAGKRVEMREVEQSLCEFDKYSRALFNEGQLKRRYP